MAVRWFAALVAATLALAGTPAWARPNSIPVPADPAKACAAVKAADFSQLLDAPTGIITATVLPFRSDNHEYGPTNIEICEVIGFVAPTIGFKLIMPTKGWNGKYLQGGCGGGCGTTKLFWCDDPLRRGYACLGSDMGHQGNVGDWRWAWNNIQLQGDFGFRSTHVASLAGKAVVAAFYGRPARLSYYWGCSTGGRQAYHEAEFYPADFAGIVGGSPPLNETGSAVQIAWTVKANLRADGSEILGVPEAQLLHRAVVDLCDMNDGIKDGLIGDARACRFNPATIICKAGQSGRGTCLTAEQAEAARRMYAGPHDSKGKAIGYYGGVMPGSEINWVGDYIDGPTRKAQYRAFIANVFRYIGFNPGPGPNWTLNDLDFDRDPARLQINEALYRADNPDFRLFRAAGGKFISFQGWSDTSIVPLGTVDFYETVARTMGGYARTKDFFRFYAVPGMRHCSADGDGADNIDTLTALENWVEQGSAPDMLIGYNFDWHGPATAAPVWPLDPARVRFARPLFPYPEQAIYRGSGDANDPKNWRRVTPRPSPDNG
ncbi:tannase/feruloyl esterase family alpha/beta hydrolase [Sphingomonas sp. AR_OL41]|uniref:tannase/feruloyl esterase family alpha/beta hydrolase n=1 Tax=Sphingomonas sp. AR_OL41 TaxID=3042729 RepID=UPI0024814F9B|nr:tannase/feruloyl esterase family alpha/beta hydrolase [Sphingomonas sp. AR_OL41]MDH7973251.1 tannase/feruloyl esterase family alpha/beta hydrolase [Sphingomonas sp. AR_OL41]